MWIRRIKGGGGIPVTDIEIVDDIVTIKAEKIDAEFKGKIAGDEIIGELNQGGPTPRPVTLKRGEYIAPVYSLNLSKKVMDQLLGEWQGTLKTPNVSLTVVFRFEMTENGEFVGFHDSPDQGGRGVPITDANLKDDKLTLMMKRIGAEFNGQLSGSELPGEWTQSGMSFPVSFTKENL